MIRATVFAWCIIVAGLSAGELVAGSSGVNLALDVLVLVFSLLLLIGNRLNVEDDRSC